MKKHFIILILVLFSMPLIAQNVGVIEGKIIDSQTREPIEFANVIVTNQQVGAITNQQGEFTIKNVTLGYVNLTISILGYTTKVTSDYYVTKEIIPFVEVELEASNEELDEVVITRSTIRKSLENPLSTQVLGVTEIEKNPGGNRDVLKVLQSLPGVATNPGFRNDVIIRGGAPFESKFYLDGIEVPVINHFQTQGATGGPVGIINADLIREVNFSTSAFLASQGNALSAITNFKQKNGNTKHLNARVTLGTSDAGITLDGPISKNATFIASFRQSYLKFIFEVLKLPFLPTYNDFQVNTKFKLSEKDELSIIALGAIDNFKLNTSVNDNVTDEDDIKRNEYIISNIPISEQWNYTVGASYKHYSKNSFQNVIISRNEWKNEAIKYFNNTNNPNDLLVDYDSKEIENKFRFENVFSLANEYKLKAGFNFDNVNYTNTTFQKIATSNGNFQYVYNTDLNFNKYGIYSQLSKRFKKIGLGVSAGFRFDGANYSDQLNNMFQQFSPRVALNYNLTKALSLNFTTGIYYQLPAYTILGFKNNDGEYVNKQNEVKYLQAKHIVTGLEYVANNNSKIAVEGFYKKYNNYPTSLTKGISLANLGSDFGVVGNEEVVSNSDGRAYGFEVFGQKTSTNGLYGIASYTYVVSEFKNGDDNYTPSSWDNRHLLTLTAGKKLKRNWEIGTKFRYIGGQPYTPYDIESSSIIENYNTANSGILNYAQLNTKRYSDFHQLDLRVDKTWFWNKFSLNFYIDIQNVYGKEFTSQPYLTPQVDANGNRVIDENDSSKYVLEEINNSSGTVLPSFGFILDF